MILLAVYFLAIGALLLWWLISPESLLVAGPFVLAGAAIAAGLGILAWRAFVTIGRR